MAEGATPTFSARARSSVATALVVGVVASAGAAFAHAFRSAVEAGTGLLAGPGEDLVTRQRVSAWAIFGIVTLGLLVAAAIGQWALRWRGERLGLTAVAAAARGEGVGPSLVGTLLRATGTLAATSGLASLGRETPILETGGSIGTFVGRITRRSPAMLAVAGIAAGFAAAYHAPIAAVLYVEEHLGVRRDRRAITHAVAGAALGYVVLREVFGGEPIFPAAAHPAGGSIVVLAAVGLVPAMVASRLFLLARERWPKAVDGTTIAARRWAHRVAFAVIGGAIVALVPLTAGNGMAALRHASTNTTIEIAVGLCLAKLIATSAAVAAGAPGGVFSPSLAVAAGAALLGFVALSHLGVPLPGTYWDGMLVAMTIGIAVGIRSPLVATIVVAEMTGDLRLLPVSAATVLVATVLDRALDRRRAGAGAGEPVAVTLHDEDA